MSEIENTKSSPSDGDYVDYNLILNMYNQGIIKYNKRGRPSKARMKELFVDLFKPCVVLTDIATVLHDTKTDEDISDKWQSDLHNHSCFKKWWNVSDRKTNSSHLGNLNKVTLSNMCNNIKIECNTEDTKDMTMPGMFQIEPISESNYKCLAEDFKFKLPKLEPTSDTLSEYPSSESSSNDMSVYEVKEENVDLNDFQQINFSDSHYELYQADDSMISHGKAMNIIKDEITSANPSDTISENLWNIKNERDIETQMQAYHVINEPQDANLAYMDTIKHITDSKNDKLTFMFSLGLRPIDYDFTFEDVKDDSLCMNYDNDYHKFPDANNYPPENEVKYIEGVHIDNFDCMEKAEIVEPSVSSKVLIVKNREISSHNNKKHHKRKPRIKVHKSKTKDRNYRGLSRNKPNFKERLLKQNLKMYARDIEIYKHQRKFPRSNITTKNATKTHPVIKRGVKHTCSKLQGDELDISDVHLKKVINKLKYKNYQEQNKSLSYKYETKELHHNHENVSTSQKLSKENISTNIRNNEVISNDKSCPEESSQISKESLDCQERKEYFMRQRKVLKYPSYDTFYPDYLFSFSYTNRTSKGIKRFGSKNKKVSHTKKGNAMFTSRKHLPCSKSKINKFKRRCSNKGYININTSSKRNLKPKNQEDKGKYSDNINRNLSVEKAEDQGECSISRNHSVEKAESGIVIKQQVLNEQESCDKPFIRSDTSELSSKANKRKRKVDKAKELTKNVDTNPDRLLQEFSQHNWLLNKYQLLDNDNITSKSNEKDLKNEYNLSKTKTCDHIFENDVNNTEKLLFASCKATEDKSQAKMLQHSSSELYAAESIEKRIETDKELMKHDTEHECERNSKDTMGLANYSDGGMISTASSKTSSGSGIHSSTANCSQQIASALPLLQQPLISGPVIVICNPNFTTQTVPKVSETEQTHETNITNRVSHALTQKDTNLSPIMMTPLQNTNENIVNVRNYPYSTANSSPPGKKTKINSLSKMVGYKQALSSKPILPKVVPQQYHINIFSTSSHTSNAHEKHDYSGTACSLQKHPGPILHRSNETEFGQEDSSEMQQMQNLQQNLNGNLNKEQNENVTYVDLTGDNSDYNGGHRNLSKPGDSVRQRLSFHNWVKQKERNTSYSLAQNINQNIDSPKDVSDVELRQLKMEYEKFNRIFKKLSEIEEAKDKERKILQQKKIQTTQLMKSIKDHYRSLQKGKSYDGYESCKDHSPTDANTTKCMHAKAIDVLTNDNSPPPAHSNISLHSKHTHLANSQIESTGIDCPVDLRKKEVSIQETPSVFTVNGQTNHNSIPRPPPLISMSKSTVKTSETKICAPTQSCQIFNRTHGTNGDMCHMTSSGMPSRINIQNSDPKASTRRTSTEPQSHQLGFMSGLPSSKPHNVGNRLNRPKYPFTFGNHRQNIRMHPYRPPIHQINTLNEPFPRNLIPFSPISQMVKQPRRSSHGAKPSSVYTNCIPSKQYMQSVYPCSNQSDIPPNVSIMANSDPLIMPHIRSSKPCFSTPMNNISPMPITQPSFNDFNSTQQTHFRNEINFKTTHPPNWNPSNGNGNKVVSSNPRYQPGNCANTNTNLPQSDKISSNSFLKPAACRSEKNVLWENYTRGTLTCGICQNKAMFVCSQCKEMPYCSEECQSKSWSKHGPLCSKAVAQRNATKQTK